jgi:hypothetical protein
MGEKDSEIAAPCWIAEESYIAEERSDHIF